MLMVIGKMKMAQSAMDDIAEDIVKLVPQVLKEDGCVHYSLAVENNKNGLIAVCEVWRDDAALAVHLEQPWVIDFSAKFMPLLETHTLKIFNGDFVKNFGE